MGHIVDRMLLALMETFALNQKYKYVDGTSIGFLEVNSKMCNT